MKTKAFIGDDPGRGENVHGQDEDMREQTFLFAHCIAFRRAVGHCPTDEHLVGCVFIGKEIYEGKTSLSLSIVGLLTFHGKEIQRIDVMPGGW